MAKLTLKARFKYHTPTPDQLPRYEALRKAAYRFARMIEKTVPLGPERQEVISRLEHVLMAANKLIALESFKRE